jgi:hypothetical protein
MNRFVTRACGLAVGIAAGIPTDLLAEDVHLEAGGAGIHMSITADPSPHGRKATRESAVIESSSEAYRLVYEPNPDGLTLMRVLSPEGAQCQVFDGKTLVVTDDVPLSFAATPDKFYRIILRMPDGLSWEKKLSARRRQTGSLWVFPPGAAPTPQTLTIAPVLPTVPPPAFVPPPVAAPARSQGMSDGDFRGLKSAIEQESFPRTKMNVLTTAASGSYFTVDQVGELVDLFDFPNDKVKVVEVVRARLLDRQNGYRLYSHFDFPNDKERVKQLLEGK